jgi:hypothetical protein
MKDLSDVLSQLTDTNAVASMIASDKERLFSLIKSKVHNTISNLTPEKSLSFSLLRQEKIIRTVSFSLASPEYIKILYHYMRKQQYEGMEIDSAVTPVAVNAVEQAIIEFYSGEKTVQAVTQTITESIQGNGLIGRVVRNEVGNNQEWLIREIKIYFQKHAAHSLAGDTIDAIAGRIAIFFHTAVGKSLLAALGKFMATSAGKMLAYKLAGVVAHVVASAAFKTAIVAVIKKIGVSILIKTVVGKVILLILASIGITGIPIFWIIAPIIAGILVYEYIHFPAKIAEKVSLEAEKSLRLEFDALNISVVQELIQATWKQIVDEATKVQP